MLVKKQSACLAVDPITIGHFTYLILHTGGLGFRLYDGSTLNYLLCGLSWKFLCLFLGQPGIKLVVFVCSCIPVEWCDLTP